MKALTRKIKELRSSDLKSIVEQRLKEFSSFKAKGNDDWFCELAFCILTANSKARTAIAIQKELGITGFLCEPQDKICICIKRNKHRFHNNKAKYIVEARSHRKIKDILQKESDPRSWLVGNIKGLGWKEASHFLRNVGYTDFAIVDRHVVNILREHGMVDIKPKGFNKKAYLEIESILEKLCDSLKMSQAELDLYLWYMKTGEVLK